MKTILGLLVLLIFNSCTTNNDVAGNGTEVSNGYTITGELTYNNNAAEGIEVILNRENFNPLIDTISAKDTTDSEGKYSFEVNNASSYIIMAKNSDNTSMFLSDVISVSKDTILPADTLKNTGTVIVEILDSVDNAYVYVPGTDLYIEISAGLNEITVPSGNIDVNIYYENDDSTEEIITDEDVDEGEVITTVATVAAYTITTVAGNGIRASNGDGGDALSASVNSPCAIAYDKNDNLYITEYGIGKVRKVDTSGIITSLPNCFITGIWAIVADASDNLYITSCKYGDHSIYKYNLTTDTQTKIAGNGTGGYSGDGGDALLAQFNNPVGLAIGPDGHLYVADQLNFAVRKIDLTTGIITTALAESTITNFVGTFTSYETIDFDINGDLLIGGGYKIIGYSFKDSSFTWYGGNGTQGTTGDGNDAKLAEINAMHGICSDYAGNLLFSDGTANTIRRITIDDGKIDIIAGTGASGWTGDGGDALSATFTWAKDLYIKKDGSILVCDTDNDVIRMLIPKK